jgi:hypothetical protein
MYKYFFPVIFLAGCVSVPPQKTPSNVCEMTYDPYLCIITIDTATFAGYGANKCLALKELQATLIEHNHNPLVAQQAECGRVHQ